MKPQSVFQAVAGIAERFPGRPALSGVEGSWTYAGLVEHAEALAADLAQRGCRADTTLAVVAGNNALTPLVWLASARCGTIVSLVNFMLQAGELAVVFDNLRPRIVFCDAARFAVCREALNHAGLESECILLQGDDGVGLQRGGMLDGPCYAGPHPSPGEAHEISYTSGTTSAPKGVLLTHRAVLERGRQEVDLFGFVPQDAAVVVTPLFHQSGIRNTVLVMWLAGGHAVIAPKFDAATFWSTISRHRATYCCLVETMLHFLERLPVADEETRSPLRRALANGDPEVLERMERRFGMRCVNVYGMTENGVPVAAPLDLGAEELAGLRRWRSGASFAGWPLPGVELRLVDEQGVVTKEGMAGEIQVRSPGLLREYYRNPEATEAAFVEGWFRTGDLAMYGPNGSVYFLDRMKDIIRRGGENIASKDVEGVLAAHPAVDGVAVVPVPDPVFQQEVKAVVVARRDTPVTAPELWEWCAARLARYKVPRYIEFRDSLPVGGTGRVQKQILREEGVAGQGRTYDRREETIDA